MSETKTDAIKLMAELDNSALSLLNTTDRVKFRGRNRYNEIAREFLVKHGENITAEQRRLIVRYIVIDEHRPVTLNVRISNEENDALKASAEADGLTVSDYVRQKLFE